MAEVLGVVASIAGVTTAGFQIAKRLYDSVKLIARIEDELRAVAREVEALSSVFDEISSALQADQSTTKAISRRAISTISDLVKDSQTLYDKIEKVLPRQTSHREVFPPAYQRSK